MTRSWKPVFYHVVSLTTFSFISALRLQAGTISINFDDGVSGNAIGSFYSGVTFSNAAWRGPLPSLQSGTASTGLVLGDITDDGPIGGGFSPTMAMPIVATFGQLVQSVSILAVNVGFAGAEIDAFDSPSGGHLIGSQSVTGPILAGSCGAPCAFELTVTGAGIQSIHLYQPTPNSGNGTFFDNLSFTTAVPEPAPWTLMSIAAAVFAYARFRLRWPHPRAAEAANHQ